MKIQLTSLIMVMMLNTILVLTMTMSKKSKMNREKNSPFECGFSPMSSPRKSFSIQFFLMATLFLIFDIEISIILPMASTKMVNMSEWLISSSMTIMILMLGLMHEWKNNMLEWSK
uniref:NADH dehydrogenase subunit 3 n=1 Tax=Euhemisphaerius bistriatus TaxID=3081096 RepID=UPI002E789216|nr:NADH dehydrogenase subunit 3 [Epyhemisphaerius bistriatus]WQB38523.1 NADH dehydrogenase subunit 3 [Epyhemisphaerius bistriatus]